MRHKKHGLPGRSMGRRISTGECSERQWCNHTLTVADMLGKYAFMKKNTALFERTLKVRTLAKCVNHFAHPVYISFSWWRNSFA